MTSIILLTLLCSVATCYGEDFNSRARNFSVELMYFTHLEHFVMSPFCVWSVMVGASLGGRSESNTQIHKATRILTNVTSLTVYLTNFTNTVFLSKPKGVEIGSSTFLFQDKDTFVRRRFQDLLALTLKAQLRILDFKDTQKTTKEANRVIQNNYPTISNVFHADDFTEASVIMSNVVFFRGLLSTPFNVLDTVEEIIYNDNNEAIGSVSMMYQKGKLLYSEFESMNSNILELPYDTDGKFCMLVIFPDPGTKTSDVFRKLEKTTFRSIFMKLENDLNERTLQEVVVRMPRFSLRGTYILNAPLNDMGMYDAFEPDYARFEHINREALYIYNVEHKADIMFAETETVALAATPGYFDHQNATYLKAQQPFLFFLMEKPTATIIFGGIYSKHRSLN